VSEVPGALRENMQLAALNEQEKGIDEDFMTLGPSPGAEFQKKETLLHETH